MQKFLLVVLTLGVFAAIGQVRAQEPTPSEVAPFVIVPVAPPPAAVPPVVVPQRKVRCTQTAAGVELSAGSIDLNSLLQHWSEVSPRRFVQEFNPNCAALILSGPVIIPKDRVDAVFEALVAYSGHVLYEGASTSDLWTVERTSHVRRNRMGRFLSMEELGSVAERTATIYTTVLSVPMDQHHAQQLILGNLDSNVEWGANATSGTIWVTARGSTLARLAVTLKATNPK